MQVIKFENVIKSYQFGENELVVLHGISVSIEKESLFVLWAHQDLASPHL